VMADAGITTAMAGYIKLMLADVKVKLDAAGFKIRMGVIDVRE